MREASLVFLRTLLNTPSPTGHEAYGCLLVRPFATFDDPWNPTSMDRLVEAVGDTAVDWPLKTRCCGGSCYCGGPVIGVMPEATMQLSHACCARRRRATPTSWSRSARSASSTWRASRTA